MRARSRKASCLPRADGERPRKSVTLWGPHAHRPHVSHASHGCAAHRQTGSPRRCRVPACAKGSSREAAYCVAMGMSQGSAHLVEEALGSSLAELLAQPLPPLHGFVAARSIYARDARLGALVPFAREIGTMHRRCRPLHGHLIPDTKDTPYTWYLGTSIISSPGLESEEPPAATA